MTYVLRTAESKMLPLSPGNRSCTRATFTSQTKAPKAVIAAMESTSGRGDFCSWGGRAQN